MKTFRNTLLAGLLAAGLLPGFSLAAEPPRGGRDPQLQQRLAEARARLEEAARQVAELSNQLGQNFAFALGAGPDGGPPPRALLGVVIDRDEQRGGGARVREVSPGGAAAEAGIRPGDLIVAIGGADLTKESDPGRALVDRMRDLEPDLKVQVGVLRDGRRQNFDVTPRPAPVETASQRLGRYLLLQSAALQRARQGGDVGVGDGARTLGMAREDENAARFRGIEFATLSERLGSYFGVKSGVLVVRAGPNADFKLQDGDVILSIDGREPTNAQHAGRILRSYQAGEKLKLRVQRDRRAQDIEVTVPRGGND